MKPVIVGTAGHIDHGKTALVKALTGIDADRLEEEKRRGITIDIGFAHLEMDGIRFGFVDVPGHEKFVRNMLAGIGGIDLVLLVIAADEGIKPQTSEHFEICRLLSVRNGITVLTKSDMVDPDTLGVVRMEVEEFLRGSFLDPAHAPIIPVSAKTGVGIDALKRELAVAARSAVAKDATSIFRLPIDRVFTMKGFGTVVTGTLISGNLGKEEAVEVMPQKTTARVRGVQVHGQAAERAFAGERTALNLAGVEKDQLTRGIMLTTPGLLRPTKRADVRLSVLKDARPVKDRARFHFHCYTTEMIAEAVLSGIKQIEPGSCGFAQLRFKEPILLLPDDKFILRQFSPVVTIGGGKVLDNAPLPRKSSDNVEDFLRALDTGSPEPQLLARVRRHGSSGLLVSEAVREMGMTLSRLEKIASALVEEKLLRRFGDVWIASELFDSTKQAILDAVQLFHKDNPLVSGISKEELRERLDLRQQIFSALLEQLAAEKKLETTGELVRAAGRQIVMKDDEAEAKQTIEMAFASAGLKVPALKDVLAGLPLDKNRAVKIVTLLLRDRVLIKLADELVFHRNALTALRKTLSDYKTKSAQKSIDVAQFKDLTGVSRKYAIPLLEHLDRERVTRREGDKRILL